MYRMYRKIYNVYNIFADVFLFLCTILNYLDMLAVVLCSMTLLALAVVKLLSLVICRREPHQ